VLAAANSRPQTPGSTRRCRKPGLNRSLRSGSACHRIAWACRDQHAQTKQYPNAVRADREELAATSSTCTGGSAFRPIPVAAIEAFVQLIAPPELLPFFASRGRVHSVNR
jgi:hypothetical protein